MLAIERALRKWAKEHWKNESIESIAVHIGKSRTTVFRIFTGESQLGLDDAMKAGIDLAWLQGQLCSAPQPVTLGAVSTRYARTPPEARPHPARA